jgi:hypothetical protein
MSRGDGWQWVAPAFESLTRRDPAVPLHVRLVTAGCEPVPAEPGQACEARVAAVTAAQLAVSHLQAGNLHAGRDLLRQALAAADEACLVYGEDPGNHHDTRRTHEQ